MTHIHRRALSLGSFGESDDEVILIPPRSDFSDESVKQQVKIHASNNAKSFPNPSGDPEGEYSTEASASAERYHSEQLKAPVSPHAHEFATPVMSRRDSGSSNGKLSSCASSELKMDFCDNGSSPGLGEHFGELQRVRDTYTKQVKALQEDLQDKETQLDQLRSQIPDDDESSSLRDELDEALQREGALERDRDELASRVRRFESGDDGMESYQDLLTRVAKAEQAQDEALARTQDYQKEISLLNAGVEIKAQEVASLNSKLESSAATSKRRVAEGKSLHEELSRKSSEFDLVEMEKGVLEQRLAASEEKQSAAQREVDQLNEQLEKRRDTLEGLEGSQRSLQEENARLAESVQTYTQNIEALNTTILELRSTEGSHRDDLRASRQENEDLRVRAQTSGKSNAELRRHLSELLLEADLSQDEDESDLADLVHSLKNEISRLRIAVATNDSELASVETELSAKQEENESLSIELARARAASSKSTTEHTSPRTGKRRKELSTRMDRETLHRISTQLDEIGKKVPAVVVAKRRSSFRCTVKATVVALLATFAFLFALLMYFRNSRRHVEFYY